ncbi:MAG: C69 family dipeptidase [Paludibacteraceae bacterium]|nr:C69 family dipeptidase [Paludibacteraceae bacterium]
MKKIFFTFLLGLAAVTYADACTNFIVGKNASVDGSTIVSYAADSYTLYGFLRMQPAADHQPGDMRQITDWDSGTPLMQIPEVAHTYSVVGNMNEFQVTIGETTWGGVDKVWTLGEGIDYGSLIYVALQRSKTAREALMCITELVEKYGYASEGESFTIADPNEVWIMDLTGRGAKGAVWVAVRVPDDCISAHANQARITTFPQKGAKLQKDGFRMQSKDGQWMWHKDIIKVARQFGLVDSSVADADFSFQAAYCPFDFSGLYACEARVWSFFRRFDESMDRYFAYATGQTFAMTNGRDAGEHMPLFVKPNRKVSVRDVQDAMRDQYQGTPIDITDGVDAGPWHSKLRFGGLGFELDSVQYWYPRPVATQQTGWSFVAQMRGYDSAKAGGIFWFGVDDAATSVYVPMYCRITEVPECFREGNGDMLSYSSTSAWWAFNLVANWAYTKYSAMLPEIQVRQQKWEDEFAANVESMDLKVASLSDADARQMLTRYSCDQAEKVTADWHDLFTYLMIRYLDGQEKKVENGQFVRTATGETEYPDRPACPVEYLNTIKNSVKHE